MRKSKNGRFTLLELLVVVAIIGLLAAYVGPKYFGQVGKSEQALARAQIDSFQKALAAYRLDTGAFPSTEEGLAALLQRPASYLRITASPTPDEPRPRPAAHTHGLRRPRSTQIPSEGAATETPVRQIRRARPAKTADPAFSCTSPANPAPPDG